ncbi:hypothetical protein DM02DRAFT_578199 [Periconia macrospinosa]|uniref:SnoaL-like domain-containing protein n=1 Tax=Periconia macrospinosa TaxID=97972 RepID=A0A2V1CX03_9PLEO|nr:hypothetical protein DM02DRAFT_578199 [Periconia macrospinosa]
MKSVTLIATTMAVLAISKPTDHTGASSSDLWIGLDLKECFARSAPIPQPNLGAQKETAKAVIDAYNAWNIDSIMAYRTPDCQHQVLPASMGRTAKSNDEYRAYLGTIMPLYSKFTVVVQDEIHDARTHSCIIHASSTADTAIGRYANEYALFLTFTEDGKNVTMFREFVDSAYSERFVAALANARSSNTSAG